MQFVFHSLQMNKLTKAAHWPTGLPGSVYCKLREPTVLTTGGDALTVHELLYLPEGIANHALLELQLTGSRAPCFHNHLG